MIDTLLPGVGGKATRSELRNFPGFLLGRVEGKATIFAGRV